MDSIRKILEQNALFAELPAEQLDWLEERVERRAWSDGHVIFRAGDPGNRLFMIERGEVRLTVATHNKGELTLDVLRSGGTFGELALLDGRPRSATATALTPTVLLAVKRDDYIGLLEREPAAARAVLRSLARIIRRMNARLVDVAMLDVHGRMAKVLLELAERYGRPTADGGRSIDHSFSNADLASLAGMYRGEVGRLMDIYEKDGLIHRDGDRITLLDPSKLESWL